VGVLAQVVRGPGSPISDSNMPKKFLLPQCTSLFCAKAEGISPCILQNSIILGNHQKNSKNKITQNRQVKKQQTTQSNLLTFNHCWPQPHKRSTFPAKAGRWMQTNKQNQKSSAKIRIANVRFSPLRYLKIFKFSLARIFKTRLSLLCSI